MMVAVVRKPSLVRGTHHLEPLAGADLVRAEHGAHLIVEDLGRRARQRAQARLFSAGEEFATG